LTHQAMLPMLCRSQVHNTTGMCCMLMLLMWNAGVLTETTAELALSLTFAAARRIVEADKFMRGGQYKGWLPNLFVGNLLQRKTVGIVGAGRIGAAYARMMMEGHKCNLVYFDPYPNKFLEDYVAHYNKVIFCVISCCILQTTLRSEAADRRDSCAVLLTCC